MGSSEVEETPENVPSGVPCWWHSDVRGMDSVCWVVCLSLGEDVLPLKACYTKRVSSMELDVWFPYLSLLD